MTGAWMLTKETWGCQLWALYLYFTSVCAQSRACVFVCQCLHAIACVSTGQVCVFCVCVGRAPWCRDQCSSEAWFNKPLDSPLKTSCQQSFIRHTHTHTKKNKNTTICSLFDLTWKEQLGLCRLSATSGLIKQNGTRSSVYRHCKKQTLFFTTLLWWSY